MTEPDPLVILTAVADAYKQFIEYEDSGFVNSAAGSLVRFETRFVRGRQFEFAFSSNPGEGDLRPIARLAAGPDGLTFWTVFAGAPQPETLRLAVASLAGISSGAAHGAASLLLEEIGGWLPTDLKEPVLLPSRIVAGVACLQIRGRHPWGLGEHSLLVEEGAYLIRGRISHRDSEQYTEYQTCRAK